MSAKMPIWLMIIILIVCIAVLAGNLSSPEKEEGKKNMEVPEVKVPDKKEVIANEKTTVNEGKPSDLHAEKNKTEEKETIENNMEYEFDSIVGLDKLELNYEAHVVGFEGETFSFNIYFEDILTDEKFEETDEAIGEFFTSYDDEVYLGYVDVSREDDKVYIYLDTGNVEPENSNLAIEGILKALNNVPGIKSVLINEDCSFDF